MKRKFYSLSRYKDKTDGNMKIGYLPREGEAVPNDFSLELFVYRATDSSAATNWKEVKTWFVVDEDCGLSVASGNTKKEAINKALEILAKVDMELYHKKREKSIETYGPVPGHGVMYLH